MSISFIGAVHQWFQGSTMVSGEREIEMTALPIGNNPSIRKLKIAIQKLTDRRPDDLHFFVPQNFRASLSSRFFGEDDRQKLAPEPKPGQTKATIGTARSKLTHSYPYSTSVGAISAEDGHCDK